MEIVDEEVFFLWKEQVTEEFPGKGQALFQVNAWLTWLEEEAEEEEGDEEEEEEIEEEEKVSSIKIRSASLKSSAVNSDPRIIQ